MEHHCLSCDAPFTPETNHFCSRCHLLLGPSPSNARFKAILDERSRRIVTLGDGRSSMSALYLVEDTSAAHPAKRYVIKIPRVSGEDHLARRKILERFDEEVQLIRRFSGQELEITARYVAHGALLSGEPYVIIEYVEGETLGRIIARHEGGLAIYAALKLIIGACRCLIPLHESNIVHRDIKPSNLILRGSDSKVLLLDFGIAQNLRSITQTRTVAAKTIMYASPEQLANQQVDHLTDIYSLGLILHILLTGQHPDESEKQMMRSTRDLPLSLPQPEDTQLSPRLDLIAAINELVIASTRFDRLHRTGSARELLARCEGLLPKAAMCEMFLDDKGRLAPPETVALEDVIDKVEVEIRGQGGASQWVEWSQFLHQVALAETDLVRWSILARRLAWVLIEDITLAGKVYGGLDRYALAKSILQRLAEVSSKLDEKGSQRFALGKLFWLSRANLIEGDPEALGRQYILACGEEVQEASQAHQSLIDLWLERLLRSLGAGAQSHNSSPIECLLHIKGHLLELNRLDPDAALIKRVALLNLFSVKPRATRRDVDVSLTDQIRAVDGMRAVVVEIALEREMGWSNDDLYQWAQIIDHLWQHGRPEDRRSILECYHAYLQAEWGIE